MITNKYGRWRARVEELLASRWARAPINVQELAATIVGMFDAGARESEVAALLRDQERTQAGRATEELRLQSQFLQSQLLRHASMCAPASWVEGCGAAVLDFSFAPRIGQMMSREASHGRLEFRIWREVA